MPRRKPDPVELDPENPEAGAPPPDDTEPKQKKETVRLVKRGSIESAVGLANGIVGMLSPGDELSMGKEGFRLDFDMADEFRTLVNAIDDQQHTSPLFRKWLGRFCIATGGVNLLGVIGLLLYVRLERRGLVPSFGQQHPAATGEPVPGGDGGSPPVQPVYANGNGQRAAGSSEAVAPWLVSGVMPVGGDMGRPE